MRDADKPRCKALLNGSAYQCMLATGHKGNHRSGTDLQWRSAKRGQKRGTWIRSSKRLRIYARDEFRCVYCDTQKPRTELTLDHVKAYSNGGTNHATNLVTACHSCNSAKKNLSLKEWCTKQELKQVRHRIRNAVRRKLP